ncbi:MAG: M20/M25/M40 family metallo-hydrolase [Fusobacteriaceae bacterium]|jgi:tripeptide aminopeptidase|nr:M20/M25/M40 family metallo-hydrolase [Fusobacteriaceae bacterium]
MIKETRLIDSFIEMVKIPSPSLNERGIGDYLLKALKELDLEVVEDDAGKKVNGNCGNITALFKGNGKRKILFSAHMDTVIPCEKINPIIEDGIIKTDGTSILGGDDKSGIAAMLEAVKVIKENNYDHPDVILAFSIAEEIGLLGASHFNIEKYSPDFGFILDSSGKPGTAVTKAPSSIKGELKIIGKAAHAGIAPETGINALYVASHAISKMKLGRIDSETTSNIGIVKGGEAGNIVMPEVSMKYEARSFSKEKIDDFVAETNEIFEKTAKEFGANFVNTVENGYTGFHIKKGSEILATVEKACNNIGLPYKEQSSGGGSDANVYNEKGFISVNIATGMFKVHTTDEMIEIKDIVDTCKLIIEMIKEFNK